MKFAKVRLSCLGCKATLLPNEVTLCQHCKAKVNPFSGLGPEARLEMGCDLALIIELQADIFQDMAFAVFHL